MLPAPVGVQTWSVAAQRACFNSPIYDSHDSFRSIRSNAQPLKLESPKYSLRRRHPAVVSANHATLRQNRRPRELGNAEPFLFEHMTEPPPFRFFFWPDLSLTYVTYIHTAVMQARALTCARTSWSGDSLAALMLYSLVYVRAHCLSCLSFASSFEEKCMREVTLRLSR